MNSVIDKNECDAQLSVKGSVRYLLSTAAISQNLCGHVLKMPTGAIILLFNITQIFVHTFLGFI